MLARAAKDSGLPAVQSHRLLSPLPLQRADAAAHGRLPADLPRRHGPGAERVGRPLPRAGSLPAAADARMVRAGPIAARVVGERRVAVQIRVDAFRPAPARAAAREAARRLRARGHARRHGNGAAAAAAGADGQRRLPRARPALWAACARADRDWAHLAADRAVAAHVAARAPVAAAARARLAVTARAILAAAAWPRVAARPSLAAAARAPLAARARVAARARAATAQRGPRDAGATGGAPTDGRTAACPSHRAALRAVVAADADAAAGAGARAQPRRTNHASRLYGAGGPRAAQPASRYSSAGRATQRPVSPTLVRGARLETMRAMRGRAVRASICSLAAATACPRDYFPLCVSMTIFPPVWRAPPPLSLSHSLTLTLSLHSLPLDPSPTLCTLWPSECCLSVARGWGSSSVQCRDRARALPFLRPSCFAGQQVHTMSLGMRHAPHTKAAHTQVPHTPETRHTCSTHRRTAHRLRTVDICPGVIAA
mmetsp:Transcript_50009/g.167103  ORF Transcript_50009/g.167103 Transcript_50009/m.167103 type:complete len:487 (-) Transcript_50009:2785-4245(-)